MKKFKILSFYPRKDAMSEKTISSYCPFKTILSQLSPLSEVAVQACQSACRLEPCPSYV